MKAVEVGLVVIGLVCLAASLSISSRGLLNRLKHRRHLVIVLMVGGIGMITAGLTMMLMRWLK